MDDTVPESRRRRKLAAEQTPDISSQRNRAPKESGNNNICLNDDENCDEDYMFFLMNNAKFGVGYVERIGNANNPDPQYESFLKHLRQDGKSYTVVVEGDAGERILVKYEAKEDLYSEGHNVYPKRLKTISPGLSEKVERVASARNFTTVLRNERCRDLRNPKGTLGTKGNDKASHLKKELGTKEAVRNSKESSCRGQEILLTNRKVAVQNGSNAWRKEDCKGKPPRPREINCTEKQQGETEEWDESYLVFMHYIRNDGEVLVFNHGDWKVRYEEDEFEKSSSSDLEILAPEDILGNEENNPFVPSKVTIVCFSDNLFTIVSLIISSCLEFYFNCHQYD